MRKQNQLYEIVPAILPKDFSALKTQVQKVADKAPVIQLDLCDGRFVPTTTWPFETKDVAGEVLELKKLLGKSQLELDCMVVHSKEICELLYDLPIKRVLIHTELAVETRHKPFADMLRARGIEVGFAISLHSFIESLEPYCADVERQLIQVMGIARIGFQGQPIDERVFPRLRALRARYPRAILSVDGGVSRAQAARLLQAGANRLVVGSALFSSPDIDEALHFFSDLPLQQ